MVFNFAIGLLPPWVYPVSLTPMGSRPPLKALPEGEGRLARLVIKGHGLCRFLLHHRRLMFLTQFDAAGKSNVDVRLEHLTAF